MIEVDDIITTSNDIGANLLIGIAIKKGTELAKEICRFAKKGGRMTGTLITAAEETINTTIARDLSTRKATMHQETNAEGIVIVTEIEIEIETTKGTAIVTEDETMTEKEIATIDTIRERIRILKQATNEETAPLTIKEAIDAEMPQHPDRGLEPGVRYSLGTSCQY